MIPVMPDADQEWLMVHAATAQHPQVIHALVEQIAGEDGAGVFGTLIALARATHPLPGFAELVGLAAAGLDAANAPFAAHISLIDFRGNSPAAVPPSRDNTKFRAVIGDVAVFVQAVAAGDLETAGRVHSGYWDRGNVTMLIVLSGLCGSFTRQLDELPDLP